MNAYGKVEVQPHLFLEGVIVQFGGPAICMHGNASSVPTDWTLQWYPDIFWTFGEVKYGIGHDSWGMQPAALSLHLLRYTGFRMNVILWVGRWEGHTEFYFENHTKK